MVCYLISCNHLDGVTPHAINMKVAVNTSDIATELMKNLNSTEAISDCRGNKGSNGGDPDPIVVW